MAGAASLAPADAIAGRPALPALKAADFQRVLASRPVAHSALFALHRGAAGTELSTRQPMERGQLVDEFSSDRPDAAGTALSAAMPLSAGPVPDVAPAAASRLGLVVPKRLARRAVTRNLIKRQARAAWQRHGVRLAAGDWVLRLKAPIPRERFPSAASEPLKRWVAVELDAVFASAARRLADPAAARRS